MDDLAKKMESLKRKQAEADALTAKATEAKEAFWARQVTFLQKNVVPALEPIKKTLEAQRHAVMLDLTTGEHNGVTFKFLPNVKGLQSVREGSWPKLLFSPLEHEIRIFIWPLTSQHGAPGGHTRCEVMPLDEASPERLQAFAAKFAGDVMEIAENYVE